MCYIGLDKKSFQLICYFQTEVKIDDSTDETFIFLSNDNSIDSDMITGTDTIDEGT